MIPVKSLLEPSSPLWLAAWLAASLPASLACLAGLPRWPASLACLAGRLAACTPCWSGYSAARQVDGITKCLESHQFEFDRVFDEDIASELP